MEVLGAEELLLGLASPIFMATTGLANYLGRRIVKLLVYKKNTIVFLVFFSSTFALLQLVDKSLFIHLGRPSLQDRIRLSKTRVGSLDKRLYTRRRASNCYKSQEDSVIAV